MGLTWCLVLGHNWEQLTDWLPVAERFSETGGGKFEEGVRILALGRCTRCGRTEPRPCRGTFTWGYGTGKSEVSLEQAHKEWAKQLERRGLFDGVMERLAR